MIRVQEIVRLKKFLDKKMGKHISFSLSFLREYKGTICCNCGESNPEKIQYHHIVPLSLGGKDILSNIVAICEKCHSKIHSITYNGAMSHSELTKQGLEAARKKGRVGGRPATDKDKLATAAKLYSANEMSVKAICETVGVSKSVLYTYVKNNNLPRRSSK